MSPLFLNPAARTQMMMPGVIAIAIAVFVIGLTRLVFTWMPPSLGDVQWRFEAAVQLLATAPQIALVLATILFAATYGGFVDTVRWTGIVTIAFAAIFVAVVPFFALDFLVVRHVRPLSEVASFTREGLRLGATTAGLGIVLGWAGWRAFKAAERDPEMEMKVGHGLIVAQEDSAQGIQE